jgi:uncharacterized membrane protein
MIVEYLHHQLYHATGNVRGSNYCTPPPLLLFAENGKCFTLQIYSDTYERWLPWVAILFIITVIIPPIALVIYLSRNRHRFNDEEFRGRWGQLYEPFQSRAFWWGIMVLFRRVIFTLVDIVLVVLPSFKFMIFTMLHLLSLIIHVLVQPYAKPLFNQAELATLAFLVLLGIILSTFPTPDEIKSFTSIRILISVVVRQI